MSPQKDKRRWNVYFSVRNEIKQQYDARGKSLTRAEMDTLARQKIEKMSEKERHRYEALVAEIKEKSKLEKSSQGSEMGREKLKPRCSPSSIVKMYSQFSETQQACIEDMGFEILKNLEFQEFKSDELAEALACLDTTSMVFSVADGDRVQVSDLSIANILLLNGDGRKLKPVPKI